jgi:SSS family solute:Na+ symporter
MEYFADIVQHTNFGPIDWIILFVYLVATVTFGMIARKYVSDMDDYVVAGRGVRTALGVATLTGTELGLVTVMYASQKGFNGGFAAFHIGLAAGIVAFLIGLSGFIIGPLRKHDVLTIPDFYRKRFGRKTQILGGLMLAFGGILNMSLFLMAGAKFLQVVMGLQNEYALLILMAILVMAELSYTVLGGMVSVVMNDYLQFVVLAFGMVLATIMAINHVGWNHVFETIASVRGEAGFNPLIAESEFGVDYVLFMVFLGIVNCALWPTSVARALASENVSVVKKQFMWASIGYAIRMIIPYFWGIAAFVFILGIPDLKEAFFPSDPTAAPMDTLYGMPVFFSRVLPTGMIGLITAAMVAAMMSTDSSYFLCWGSVLTNDVIVPLSKGELTQRSRVWITRGIILLIGVTIFVMSYAYPLGQDLWDFMTVSGAIYFTGAFGVLLGGLYWKRASSTGAVLSICAGGLAVLGLEPVQELLFVKLLPMDDATAISIIDNLTAPRVGLCAVAAAVLAMIVGSLLFPDKPATHAAGAVTATD